MIASRHALYDHRSARTLWSPLGTHGEQPINQRPLKFMTKHMRYCLQSPGLAQLWQSAKLPVYMYFTDVYSSACTEYMYFTDVYSSASTK